MTLPNQDGSTSIDWTSIRTLRNTLRAHLAEVEPGTHLEVSDYQPSPIEGFEAQVSKNVRPLWKSTIVASTNKLADLLALERVSESRNTTDWDIISDDPKTRLQSPLVRRASTIEATSSTLLSAHDPLPLPAPQEFELFDDDQHLGVFSEQPPLPGTLITLVQESGGYMVKVTRIDLGPNNRLRVATTQVLGQADAQAPCMTLSIG